MQSKSTLMRLVGAGMITIAVAPWLGVGQASANASNPSGDVRAISYDGNAVTCADAGLAGSIIDVTATDDGTYIDITATPSTVTVTGVVVKGGDSYNVYLPGSLGSLPWLDLHSPVNASGGPAGISHYYVCGTTTTESSTPPVTESSTPPVTESSTPPVTESSTPPVTESSTPPVTESSTPPVTSSTPPVTSSTPPVTSSTPPVTSSTPPVTSSTPPVTSSTPPVTTPATSTTPAVTTPAGSTTPPTTSNSSVAVLPTKIGNSSEAATPGDTEGTGVLSSGGTLPHTGSGLPLGLTLLVSLALLIGGGALMLLPGLSVVSGNRRRH